MKNLKYLLFIIPFLFLNNVKAEEKIYKIPPLENYVDRDIFSVDLNSVSSIYTPIFIDTNIKELVIKWEKDYKKDYPYYVISVYKDFSDDYDFVISLSTRTTIPSSLSDNSALAPITGMRSEGTYVRISRCFKNGNLIKEGTDVDGEERLLGRYYIDGNIYNNVESNIGRFYNLSVYYDSNFDMPFGLENTTYTIMNKDTVLFTLNDKNDIVPTYKSKFINKTDLNYTEIDLNNYPYVALSLKDYSKTEEFNSMTYVKGQYCLTSVYNYGLTERKDILSGTKMQRCSLYYDDYTPIRTYILKSDLENHSIYYLKAYDKSKENKIKVDTSVFNIHYITEEEKNNPIITINGKKYTTIPYDELTDTATKSEDENYTSGGSCAVGDINCTASLTNGSIKWSDIFTSPLDFLKNIWTSITQVFTLIAYFIALLPTTLQYFFYISFTLAIVLGIIKIIL